MPASAYTVLVVDDSRTNRAYLRYVLEEEGFGVVEAASGEECLELVARDPPILVLLDVVMTGIDGFETLKRLKADRRSSRIPVIMLTSLDDEVSKLKAFELGAVDYVTKSARAGEVRARVRVHVRLFVANIELAASRAESVRQISSAQQALLVKGADMPDARFAVYYRSLHGAGGDFYEVIRVSEGVHFYFVGDVAGHDLGTSYVTPAVKVLLSQFATPAYSPEETLAELNRVLAATVCADTYLTAFALRLNRKSGKATYLAAGHPPAVYLPHDGPPRFLESENPFVGMIEDSIYRSSVIDVAKGDRFLLYTDGLVEGGGAAWTEAGAGLLPVLARLRDLPLAKLPDAVVAALSAGGAGGAADDVAVLAAEF